MAVRTSSESAPQRRAVLYVEQDAAAIHVARQVLAQRGLELTIAPDLARAMTLALRKPPELMLVNVEPAALGVASLMHILRANPATRAAPVLALGTDAAPEAAVKALEAGFFLYLVAPLDAAHLSEALDYALEFSALERAEL
jgi:two-component system sensor histidine kinase/response regulator